MIKWIWPFLLTIGCLSFPWAGTIPIGPGLAHGNLPSAAARAGPGDTLLFHAGTYPGGITLSGLRGTPARPITILAEVGKEVIIHGGSEAWHLVEPAHVIIRGITFKNNTSNGVNCDDGGTFDTPAHHIQFQSCTFRDMKSGGNNDLLKMSGVDDFEIRDCLFLNGSSGSSGSGLDMVGCHRGLISGNRFLNMGANAIQVKGGSQHVTIQRNFFKDCGHRTLNLGGSTGLAYFRPPGAKFEAADVFVYSNVFVGSQAPIAYVTSVRVHVVNNTIYHPGNWVMRILQEQSDLARFVSCGEGVFLNNIVVLGKRLSTECNVGNNTRPQTFTISNNLWYNSNDVSWTGPPRLPVTEKDGIVGKNPLLNNPGQGVFSIPANSPAAGAGIGVSEPELDYTGVAFGKARAIGAFEANSTKLSSSFRWVAPTPSIKTVFRDNRLEIHYAIRNEVRFDFAGRKIKGR